MLKSIYFFKTKICEEAKNYPVNLPLLTIYGINEINRKFCTLKLLFQDNSTKKNIFVKIENVLKEYAGKSFSKKKLN